MTARAVKGPLTRIYLVERFDPLADRIENALNDSGARVGFERATNVVSAARDLAFIEPDVVVVNVDEMEAFEWDTLTRMREAYPRLRFYGLSGNPAAKSELPGADDACDGYFPLVSNLNDLKEKLITPRAC